LETITLTNLTAAIRQQSDTRGLLLRHPDADIFKLVNRAIRDLRGLVTTSGLPYFITSTAATTLASTRISDEDYSEVPFPVAATQIHGVEVQLGSAGQGGWYPLAPIPWQQRRNIGLLPLSANVTGGAVRHFAIRTLPNNATPGAIALFPYADSGMYKIWYLPDFTDLAAGSDTFSGLPSMVGWVIHSCCFWLAQEDDERIGMASAESERNRLQGLVMSSIGPVQSAGPLRPKRVRGRFGRW
jgi:hypothetical protein